MDKKVVSILIVGIILLIMWGSFGWFIMNYGKEVRTDPCSICAEKMGKGVTCYKEGATRYYNPDGTIDDERSYVREVLVPSIDSDLIKDMVSEGG